jgi:predicted nucleic acid-binding protein
LTLVDTSVWVEFDRATGSAADSRLTAMIRHSESIAVTEPVMMEVLAGARTLDRQEKLRRLLLSFNFIPFDPILDFDGAVQIYRTCRNAGVTPRGLVDCMIMAVALRGGVQVLAHDADFGRAANVVGLVLAAGSLKPAMP